MNFVSFKSGFRAVVEQFLTAAFEACDDTEVCRVARYISLGGGHRWRALVAAAAGEIFCNDAQKIVLPGAAAVELSHCASLILDDLPSMDDGQRRRGKPCAHLIFPQWAVDMAPVFLVTLSYELALNNPLATPERRVLTAVNLSRAGLDMIAGQTSDVSVSSSKSDEEILLQRYRLKSGALYAAAASAGALLCGASVECGQRISEAGMFLGLSYQFLDDVADAIGDSAVVGKDTGRDIGKPTSVFLFGVNGARRRSQQFQEQALDCLSPFGPRADWLRMLVTEASWAPS